MNQTQIKKIPPILIIEDNIDDYEATMRSFNSVRLNNPIYWCGSGREGLDFLNKNGEYDNSILPLPSLILLDLNMPGMDGLQVLKEIKDTPELKRIPVVILTTSSDEQDINTCYELGASTYICKPVEFDGLLEAVRKIKSYWFEVAILPREM